MADRINKLKGKFQAALERSEYKAEYIKKLEDHNLQWLNNHRSYNIFNNSYEISRMIQGKDNRIDTVSNMHARNPLEFHRMKGLTSYKFRKVREDNKNLRQALKMHPRIFHKTKAFNDIF